MLTLDQTIEPEVNRVELRRTLHELANLFTAILITSGLLKLAAHDLKRIERYRVELLESGERGAALVREARSMLMAPEERMKIATAVTHQRDEHHVGEAAEEPAKVTFARSARKRTPRRLA